MLCASVGNKKCSTLQSVTDLGFQYSSLSFLPVTGHCMQISDSHYLQVNFNLSDIALLIYSLSTTWGWVVRAMLRMLYAQERVQVLIVQGAGGAPGLVQMGVGKRKSLAPIGV